MWISNENFPKTKVEDLEKLHKFGIQHFFIWAQEDVDNFSLQRGPWTFGKWNVRVKGLKTYSNPIQKYAKNKFGL